jgi:hypothetical protein
VLLVILLKLRKYVANDVLSTNVREEALELPTFSYFSLTSCFIMDLILHQVPFECRRLSQIIPMYIQIKIKLYFLTHHQTYS